MWVSELIGQSMIVFPPPLFRPPSCRSSQKLPGRLTPAPAVKMFGQQVLVLSK